MPKVISVRIVVVVMITSSIIADAAVYYVGDEQGWNENPQLWLGDRTFKTGDVLVFNYDKGRHNVVVFYETDYDYYEDCVAPENATTYASGHDLVKLRKGFNYIISTMPGDCDDYFLAFSPFAT